MIRTISIKNKTPVKGVLEGIMIQNAGVYNGKGYDMVVAEDGRKMFARLYENEEIGPRQVFTSKNYLEFVKTEGFTRIRNFEGLKL